MRTTTTTTTSRLDRRRLLISALCGGYFLILLDVSVVNVALPSIGKDLDASGAGLAWIIDAYAIPLAALLLAVGALGDRIGHRRTVLLGLVGFGIASALCALATHLPILIIGRGIQGVAAALMLPGTLAVLSDIATDDADRSQLVGTWAAVGGIALPTGPVVGGLLVQTFGWPAVFWLNVPIIACLTIVVALATTTSAHTARHNGTGRVDWPGALLLTVSMGGVTLGITQAESHPLRAAVSVGIALCALVALAVVEHPATANRLGTTPLIRIPRPARLALLSACAVAGVMNLCTLGTLFLLTQTLQLTHHHSPVTTGLLMLPALAPLPLVAAPAARLGARRGVWPTAALGLAVGAVGLAVVAGSVPFADGVPALSALLCGSLLWGTGIGILTPAVVAAALVATPTAPGLASGASNTARQFGGALGVAVFAAVTGSALAPGYGGHAAAVIAGAAAAFALTAIAVLVVTRRRT